MGVKRRIPASLEELSLTNEMILFFGLTKAISECIVKQ